jgi:type IV fimbrial biogenesis protein FimT
MQIGGFTALELITTMAIVSILMATAVPALKNYSWNLRMKTAMEMLQTDLNLARRRAISLNAQTVACPATGTAECAESPDWQDGWIVFVDLNGDRQKQNTEPLLKQTGEMEFLSITSSNSRKNVRFYPNGTAPGSNLSIVFCDQRGAGHAAKLSVSNTGRIRLVNGGIEPQANCL